MEILVDSIEIVNESMDGYENFKTLAINGIPKLCFHSEKNTKCDDWCPLFHYVEDVPMKEIQTTRDSMGNYHTSPLVDRNKQVTLCQDRVYYTDKDLQEGQNEK